MQGPSSSHRRTTSVRCERITILASSRETGGYEIFLQKGLEGSGPHPHSHPWDESFYVTKGEIDFGIGLKRRPPLQEH